MPYQDVVFPYPDAGMNEMYPAHLIGDNQFTNLVNWHYDISGRLVSRPGTEFVHRFTDPVWGAGTYPEYLATAVHSGTVLYGRSSVIGETFTSIKTGLTSGSRYFANMNGAMYSGSQAGSSTADNLKWTVTGSTVVTMPGSPPALSRLCVWNSRMWGVHRNQRTKLYFSKVGDPDDWTTGGVSGAGFIDVGYSDGESIMSIFGHNEQLWIIKERSVWHIVTANPNTDNTLWRVEFVSRLFGNPGNQWGDGISAIGNEVMFTTEEGLVALNAALYQGDFGVGYLSAPIKYFQGGSIAYVRPTGQHLYCASHKPERDIYALHRNKVWAKMHVYDARGNKLQPWAVFSDLTVFTTYGEYSQIAGGIVVVNRISGVNYFDLLFYPSTRQGQEGHYDFIGGPNGESAIRKQSASKMYTFGSLGRAKRTSFVLGSFVKHDRDPALAGDTMTMSVVFDLNDTSKKQEVVVTDVGTDVISDENTVAVNRNRTPIRTSVFGIGGPNGQTYKGIQIKTDQNIGGYGLEWSGIEMNVDKEVDNFPRPSEKMLS